MNTKHELSPREKEIVELSVEGLTNEAIAHRLELSVGTVNTYWLRIKMKKGGSGRTETVANILKERAEVVIEQERVDWEGLAKILEKRELRDVIAERERELESRTGLALLQIAIDQIQATVWATDPDLSIQVIASGGLHPTRFGINWQEGKTVYEIFKTTNENHPAVAAHVNALAGVANELDLGAEFAHSFLRVRPLLGELGEVVGCISILNTVVNMGVDGL